MGIEAVITAAIAGAVSAINGILDIAKSFGVELTDEAITKIKLGIVDGINDRNARFADCIKEQNG